MTEIDADRLARIFGAYIDRFRPAGPLGRIVRELATGTPSRLQVLEIMGEDGTDDDVLRAGMLDLVLEYIREALHDNHLSSEEQSSVRYLKSMLNVSEGDFWRLRKPEITELLKAQIESIMEDGVVSWAEAIQKVELQRVFDLGYDQFLEVTEPMRLPYDRQLRRQR